jgi:hypothetical protein
MPRGRGGKRLGLCALPSAPEWGELKDSECRRMLPDFVPDPRRRAVYSGKLAAFAPARVLVTIGLAFLRQPAVRRSVCGDLQMGKGKSAGGPNIAMRGELKKRAEMERMREQVVTADVNILCIESITARRSLCRACTMAAKATAAACRCRDKRHFDVASLLCRVAEIVWSGIELRLASVSRVCMSRMLSLKCISKHKYWRLVLSRGSHACDTYACHISSVCCM